MSIMTQSARQRVKRVVLPSGERVRRLPTGIGRGLRMGIDFQRGHTGLFVGLYEIELNPYLRRLCRPGYACFDVGGQFGYDALVLAKLTGGRVVSVDCDAAFCEVIRRNIAANPGYASRVQVRRAFVSDESEPSAGNLCLDDLAKETFVPDMVKIDIEGSEARALRGASRLLGERRPNVLLEVHSADLEQQCLGILRAAGYDPVVVDQRRWLRDHRPTTHNRWLVAEGRDKGSAAG